MIAGRIYLDPGDRLSGHNTPPPPVTVLHGWGKKTAPPALPWLTWTAPPAGAPRNVAVRRVDGSHAVVPFTRRLRIPRERINLDAFPACVHRGCSWPGCPALYDAVAVMSGEPGFVPGWMRHSTYDLLLCPGHAGPWREGTHLPRLATRAGVGGCDCGALFDGNTLGELNDAYITHLTKSGDSL